MSGLTNSFKQDEPVKTAFSEWESADTRIWADGEAPVPWHLDPDWMQPLGLVLYRTQPNAAAGVVSATASLGDGGTANFLLGSDAPGLNYLAVQIQSRLTDLVISAARVVNGEPQALPGDFTLLRQNKSFHSVQLRFDRDSVVAVVNERTIHWETQVPPGFVGFLADEKDQFRIYTTDFNLSA